MLYAFTHQCLHIECDTTLSSERVVRVLEHLHEHGIKHRDRLHCHRCTKIEVRVSLNGTNHCRIFPPSTRVAKVKAWAADAFEKSGFEGVDEMALQVAGTTEQPSADIHIGTLVTHPCCELAFNLIGKPLVQG